MMSDDKRTVEPGSGMSLRREIRNLKRNTAASADELHDFMRQMRGKSPQEMLGIVAQSNLVRSTVLATGIMAVLLVTFTIVPFAFGKIVGDKSGDKQAAAVSQPADDAKKSADANAKTDDASKAAAKTPADAAATQKASDDLLNKLGIGEAAPADAKANPLENKTDDLLKDLDK